MLLYCRFSSIVDVLCLGTFRATCSCRLLNLTTEICVNLCSVIDSMCVIHVAFCFHERRLNLSSSSLSILINLFTPDVELIVTVWRVRIVDKSGG